MTSTETRQVQLIGVPVALWHESRLWFEELLREFDVIATHADGTPARLLTFVDEVRNHFGQFSRQPNEALATAAAEEVDALDLRLELPPSAGPAAGELWERILEADAYCRHGSLLTLQLAEPHKAFIQWYLSEVTNQMVGNPARPWPAGSAG